MIVSEIFFLNISGEYAKDIYTPKSITSDAVMSFRRHLFVHQRALMNDLISVRVTCCF